MLVLSRERDEVIMIGDNIALMVVEIRGNVVRLGIEAPAEVPIFRREVYDAIQRDRRIVSRELKRTPDNEHDAA